MPEKKSMNILENLTSYAYGRALSIATPFDPIQWIFLKLWAQKPKQCLNFLKHGPSKFIKTTQNFQISKKF
jgi:hypothetical protein